MPKYNLRLHNKTLTVAETDKPLSSVVGRKLARSSPDSWVEGGNTISRDYFSSQEYDRDELETVRDIRESGGLISELVHGKALMQFGTGASFEAENDEAADWLHDQFNDLDNLLLDIGEDAEWFPAAFAEIVPTKADGFSHVELIQPWTMDPKTDGHGTPQLWEQTVRLASGEMKTKRFDPEDIGVFVLNKSNGRDKTGISAVVRAMDEIESYKRHSDAIDENIDFAAFRRMHVKVGREGGAQYSDNELRRVRNKVDFRDHTTVFTGQDVGIDPIEASSIDFEGVTSHDIRKLAVALGVPIELADVISEGLGSGSQSDMRAMFFELEKQAKQRALGGQFVEQIARVLLERYSPYDPEQELDLRFNDYQTMEDIRNLVSAIGEDMTVNERRRLFDLAKLDDDELGEAFATAAEETTEDSGDPFGGMLNESINQELENRGLSDFELQESFTLQDIEDIDTTPPEGAATEAQRALDWREETGNPDGCLQASGWQRANQLADRESLSEETINRMVNFFSRNSDWRNANKDDDPPCQWVSWKAWGAEPAESWAESKQEEFANAREMSLGAYRDTWSVELAEFEDWENSLLELNKRVWDADGQNKLLTFTESQTPQFVKDRIRDAILSGTLFSDIDAIGSDQRFELQEFLLETLTSDGWTVDGLADQIEQLGVDSDRAQTIARTETAATLNKSRELGYEEQFDEPQKFYWVNTLDSRTTEACEWLTEKTNPNHGGTPVELEELKDLIEEAPTHDDEMQDNLARPNDFVVHPNERSVFVRAV